MVKQDSRNIMVFSPVPTHPLNAGNRARITALIESLQGLGHTVNFVHVTQEAGDPIEMREKWGAAYHSIPYRKKVCVPGYSRLMRKLKRRFRLRSGYVFGIDAWYDDSIEAPLLRLTRELNIDTIIVEYVWFSKILEVLDNDILKIIDAHDQFSNRHLHYLRQGKIPGWFSTTTQGESRGFDRADVVMAIQDEERVVFSGMTHASVRTVGHVVHITKPVSREYTDGSILFVASENEINVQGINWFISEIYPNIRMLLPQVVLKVAGTICEKLPDQPGVVKLGHVSCLQSLYERASVVINPVSIYTGLSIKTLEALSYSKPLVTRVQGEDKYKSGSRNAFRCAANASQFSAAVFDILDTPKEYVELSSAAYEYVVEWNLQSCRQLSEVLDIENTIERELTNVSRK